MLKYLVVFVYGLSATLAIAQQAPKSVDCFEQAAQRYQLNPHILRAIAHTESRFNPMAMSPANKNGSYDIGIMQINSSWLPTLARYQISAAQLTDACTNIHVGAWILRSNINTFGNNHQALARYNSPNPLHQARYLNKIASSYGVVGP